MNQYVVGGIRAARNWALLKGKQGKYNTFLKCFFLLLKFWVHNFICIISLGKCPNVIFMVFLLNKNYEKNSILMIFRMGQTMITFALGQTMIIYPTWLVASQFFTVLSTTVSDDMFVMKRLCSQKTEAKTLICFFSRRFGPFLVLFHGYCK